MQQNPAPALLSIHIFPERHCRTPQLCPWLRKSHPDYWDRQNRFHQYPHEALFSFLKEKIKDVLDTLTDREREVIEQRFGLRDGSPRTLEEVGRQFSVTRERIRQIEAKALRKLRHPTRISKIKGFLEMTES